jgi:Transposase IS4
MFVRIYLQHAGMLYIDSSTYVLAIYGLLTCSSFEPLHKDLFIPRAINDYNRHIKGVDQADALRANFICYRPHNHRTWWPLFYFLINVSCVNAYLL